MVANLLAAMVGILFFFVFLFFFFICTKKGFTWNIRLEPKQVLERETEKKGLKGKRVFRQDVKTVFWVCNVYERERE